MVLLAPSTAVRYVAFKIVEKWFLFIACEKAGAKISIAQAKIIICKIRTRGDAIDASVVVAHVVPSLLNNL
jgi:acyl-coenzyme A synthetase/AMP-(fatty) acid ligase